MRAVSCESRNWKAAFEQGDCVIFVGRDYSERYETWGLLCLGDSGVSTGNISD